jgi:hypothetical protein
MLRFHQATSRYNERKAADGIFKKGYTDRHFNPKQFFVDGVSEHGLHAVEKHKRVFLLFLLDDCGGLSFLNLTKCYNFILEEGGIVPADRSFPERIGPISQTSSTSFVMIHLRKTLPNNANPAT